MRSYLLGKYFLRSGLGSELRRCWVVGGFDGRCYFLLAVIFVSTFFCF